MGGFFSSLFKLLFVNVLIVLIFSYFALSFLTGEFPPKFKTIKNASTKITQVQDSMKQILSKSNAEISQQLGQEFALPQGNTNPVNNNVAQFEDNLPSDLNISPQDARQINELNKKILQLHSEIDQLRNENHALRTNLQLKK